jgi:hypothetical protein
LENDVLKLGDRLKPLSTSYTQTSDGAKEGEDADKKPAQKTDEDAEGGRPQKEQKDKAERTIQDEESKERTEGGS